MISTCILLVFSLIWPSSLYKLISGWWHVQWSQEWPLWKTMEGCSCLLTASGRPMQSWVPHTPCYNHYRSVCVKLRGRLYPDPTPTNHTPSSCLLLYLSINQLLINMYYVWRQLGVEVWGTEDCPFPSAVSPYHLVSVSDRLSPWRPYAMYLRMLPHNPAASILWQHGKNTETPCSTSRKTITANSVWGRTSSGQKGYHHRKPCFHSPIPAPLTSSSPSTHHPSSFHKPPPCVSIYPSLPRAIPILPVHSSCPYSPTASANHWVRPGLASNSVCSDIKDKPWILQLRLPPQLYEWETGKYERDHAGA